MHGGKSAIFKHGAVLYLTRKSIIKGSLRLRKKDIQQMQAEIINIAYLLHSLTGKLRTKTFSVHTVRILREKSGPLRVVWIAPISVSKGMIFIFCIAKMNKILGISHVEWTRK